MGEQEKEAVEELKLEWPKLKKVRGELVQRMVEEVDGNEELVDKYIEMMVRVVDWEKDPEKMVEWMTKGKEWGKLGEDKKESMVQKHIRGNKHRMRIWAKWEEEREKEGEKGITKETGEGEKKRKEEKKRKRKSEDRVERESKGAKVTRRDGEKAEEKGLGGKGKGKRKRKEETQDEAGRRRRN